MQAYGQAAALNPSLDQAWYRNGWIFAFQGRYDESLPLLDQATEINSKNANAWNTKGLVLLQLGRPEDAKSCFEKALALEPNNSEFQNNLEKVKTNVEDEPEKTIVFAKVQ
jgi:tetratricopeptide (TPR) repeat protein